MLPRTSCTVLGILLGGCLLAVVGVEAKSKTPEALTPQARYDQRCKSEGALNASIARARDAGVPLTAMFDAARKAAKTSETRQAFEERALVIYDAVSLTPTQIQYVMEHDCLTSAARPQE